MPSRATIYAASSSDQDYNDNPKSAATVECLRKKSSVGRWRSFSSNWEHRTEKARSTIHFLLSVSAYAITMLAIPLRIGLFYNPCTVDNDQWDVSLTIFSALDIYVGVIGIVEFFYDYRCLSQNTLPALAHNRRKMYLLMRFIAIIPLEVIAVMLRRYQLLHVLRLTKVGLLLRFQQHVSYLHKLYRNSSIGNTASRSSVSSIIVASLLGLLCAHYCACFYLFLGHAQCGLYLDQCNQGESWMIRDRLQNSSLDRQYARAIYWAARTMVLLGYDDVTPVSVTETVFVVIVQFIGAIFSTNVMATFFFAIRNRNVQYAAFITQIDNARQFMKLQNLPRPLQHQINAYFDYAWDTHRGLDSKRALHSLSTHLQSQVVFASKSNRLKQLTFLSRESAELIHVLAASLCLHVFAINDCIAEPKLNSKVFFVERGTVCVQSLEEQAAWDCQQGDYFGDISLFRPHLYTERAFARTFCELYALQKIKLENAIRYFYNSAYLNVIQRMADVAEKHLIQRRKTRKMLGLPLQNTDVVKQSTRRNYFCASDREEWRLPDSVFRARWDTFRLVATLYVLFYVPYYIAFENGPTSEDTSHSPHVVGVGLAAAYCLEVYFLMDLLLRGRYFAYVEPHVMINVVDPSMIFRAYREHGFYFDLLAVIPIASVSQYYGQAECTNFLYLRLLRAHSLKPLVLQLGQYYGLTSKTFLTLILLLVVISLLHVTACIWFGISWIGIPRASISHSPGALTRSGCLSYASLHQNCSWVLFDCYGQIGASFPSKIHETHDSHSMQYTSQFAYLRSIYWAVVALTGVGYGDIVAFTTLESYFAAVWIYIGGIINFGVVGAMSSTVSDLLASQHHHIKKLNAVNQIMEIYHIPEKLRIDIRQFHSGHKEKSKTSYESALLSHLPDQLCQRISVLLHYKAASSVHHFGETSAEFMDHITGKFRSCTYQNGETLVFEGSNCQELIVILQGCVNGYYKSQGTAIAAFRDGVCCGESAFFLQKQHNLTLVAYSPVEASIMSRDHFDELAKRYPDTIRMMRQVASDRWREEEENLLKITHNLESKQKLRAHALATKSLFVPKEQVLQSSYNRGEWNHASKRGNTHLLGMYTFLKEKSGSTFRHQTCLTSQSVGGMEDPMLIQVRWHSRWKVVLALVTLYSASILIFRLAFQSQFHDSGPHYLNSWTSDAFVDVCYALDIYLNLFYFGNREAAIIGFRNLITWQEVNLSYRHSQRFFIDVLSSAPIYYKFSSNQALYTALARVPRLIRCVRISSLLDDVIIHIQQVFATHDVSSTLGLVKLSIFLFLAAHYAACIFYWVSEQECAHQPHHCWIHHDHIIHAYHNSLASLYIRSLYWSLTTLSLVGSREVVPRSGLGTICAALTCLCCTFFMSHVIGELCELILHMSKESKQYQRQIESFDHLAELHAFPLALRNKVSAFFECQHRHISEKQIAIVSRDLSAHLRLALLRALYGNLINSLPIRIYLSMAQINCLSQKLQIELFIFGDTILAERSPGNRLCILRSGFASVLWTRSMNNVSVLVPGSLFGEISFFLTEERCTATIQAATNCEVVFISRSVWNEIWYDSPNKLLQNREHRYAMLGILSWVITRISHYRQHCLTLACRSSRYRQHRDYGGLAGSRTVATERTSLRRRFSQMNWFGQSKVTIPKPMLAEGKAKYLVAKVSEITKELGKQNSMLRQGRRKKKSALSALFTHFKRKSGLRGVSTISLQMSASTQSVARSNSKVAAASRSSLGARMVQPRGSISLSQQYTFRINPLFRNLRLMLNSSQLLDFEDECWERISMACKLEVALQNKMEQINSCSLHKTDKANKRYTDRNPLKRTRSLPTFDASYFNHVSTNFEAECSGSKWQPVVDYELLHRFWHPASDNGSMYRFYSILHGHYARILRNVNALFLSHQTPRTAQLQTFQYEDFIMTYAKHQRLWQLARFHITIYYALAVPFRAGFAQDLSNVEFRKLAIWMAVDYVFDALFVAAIALRTFSPKVGNKTSSSLSRHSGQWSEYIAAIPLELICLPFKGMKGSQSFADMWRCMSYFRLNKLFFTLKLSTLAEKGMHYIVHEKKYRVRESNLEFAWSISKYLYTGHLIACVWYIASQQALDLLGYSWLSYFGMLCTDSDRELHGYFYTDFKLSFIAVAQKYVRSLHFAIGSITTLFYGDIASMNMIELVAEFVVILLSIYVFGSLIGAHGERLVQEDRGRAVLEQKSLDLKHYMKQTDIPNELQMQARQYLKTIWRRLNGKTEHEEVDVLPKHLKEESIFATRASFAKTVSIFVSIDPCVLRALIARLSLVVCSQQEQILVQGDSSRFLYFVNQGSVLLQHDHWQDTIRRRGGFFGELAFFYSIPSMATCICMEQPTELYRLSHSDLQQILEEFPQYRHRIRKQWLIAGCVEERLKATAEGGHILAITDIDRDKMPLIMYKATIQILATMKTSIDGSEAKNMILHCVECMRRYKCPKNTPHGDLVTTL